ncbi:MAG: D-cysteine desulfhydrase family protein [Calditrichaeota bacterium]|nr:D-cysteine desulfhydrase family protein [Calditrichota bacterium]
MNFPEHFNFTRQPTPVIKLQQFSQTWDSYEIFMKRDDFTGIELSGNKVRKLDFLMYEAVQHGAGRIITCGGIQSNHCRTSAFFARKLGLKVTLVLKGSPPKVPTGNFFLNKLIEADIIFVTPEEYERVNTIMQNLADRYSEKCFIIPEGGSNATGAWGYVKAFSEIIEQMPDADTIIVPTGSGGTHAGLLLGKRLLRHDVAVISVNVCDSAEFFRRKISSIIDEFKQKYQFNFSYSAKDIHIIDGFVGEGYGKISRKEINAIKSLAKTEGIVLDPVYGAKAWVGFEENLQKGNIPGKKILFIHTGGIFGVFPFSEICR